VPSLKNYAFVLRLLRGIGGILRIMRLGRGGTKSDKPSGACFRGFGDHRKGAEPLQPYHPSSRSGYSGRAVLLSVALAADAPPLARPKCGLGGVIGGSMPDDRIGSQETSIDIFAAVVGTVSMQRHGGRRFPAHWSISLRAAARGQPCVWPPFRHFAVGAEATLEDGEWVVKKAIMSRSARVLMEGWVRVPGEQILSSFKNQRGNASRLRSMRYACILIASDNLFT